MPIVDAGDPLGMVRADPPAEQGRSTWGLAVEAVRRGKVDDAAALTGYARIEAREAYELYREWIDALPGAIVARGADREKVAAGVDAITALTGVSGPDDADAIWGDFSAAIADAGGLCAAGDREAEGAIEAARAIWREGHDRLHDHICGLLDLAAAELGESEIGPLWDDLLGRLYEGRGRFLEGGDDRETIARLVLDVAAALRGHLSGPHREGSVEIVEEGDRWRVVIPFCGSGGRTYCSSDGEGGAGPPAAGMTSEPHPWSWEAAGVCLYCVHCCQLQQKVPVETLGRPLRVVEPPRWPRDRDRPVCNWYIYKSETAIPDAAYEAVGATPPRDRPDVAG